MTRCVAAALALALFPALAAGQAPLVVKIASPAPDGTAWHAAVKAMAVKWTAASGGRVTARVFPGGVAGDDPEVVKKLESGALGAAVVMASGLGRVDRAAHALSLPLVYDSADQWTFVLGKLRPRLEAAFAARGLVALDWMDAGFVRFFATAPITTPAELRARKVFSWAGDEDQLAVWKAAGATPAPLSPAELRAAIDGGRVDAVGMPPSVALVSQHYLKLKHMTALDWQPWVGAIVIGQRTLDQLPSDVRPALLAAAREAGEAMRRDSRAAMERDVAEMKARGLAVVAVDAAAKAAWRKAEGALLPQLRGTIVPAEAFDEALKWRDEHRRNERGAR
jgi:TRAP-type C4-dicarboxylate transport system substrate-binding protein